jgi:hypothetical protein
VRKGVALEKFEAEVIEHEMSLVVLRTRGELKRTRSSRRRRRKRLRPAAAEMGMQRAWDEGSKETRRLRDVRLPIHYSLIADHDRRSAM